MSEASELDVTASPVPDIPVRDEDEHLNREFIAAVEAAIEANDQDGLRHLAADLHEADTGDLLETLDPEDRASFIRLLGEDFDYTALTEIDEAVRLQVLEDLPTEVIAEGLGELDSDDAVYILEDLDEDDQAAILEELPYADRAQLQKALDYPEESAGRRMQTEFIAVAPFWTIGQTIDYMREARDLPDSFYEIYVVDPTFKLLGSVHLDKILRTKRDEKVTSIMEETRQAVLMPIVASMGGNAGTQTMTVAVRGIATQELGARNLLRVLNREILVSVFNGVALAILIGVTAWMWFGSPGLGVVIGGAIVINLLFAGLSGLLIPIALDKMNVDPAIASSVFVTTVTDVVGFFAFLGIAALWFGLPF
jgi:Mg/Co/Ni transporter MgtE